MKKKGKSKGLHILKQSIVYTLMVLGAVFVGLIVFVAIAVEFFPDSHLTRWVQTAVAQDTTAYAPLETDINEAFRTALQNEVKEQLGMPIEGYEPAMFLEVFPGLTETDFEGVEASLGYYTIENGALVHVPDPSRLVHSAAAAVSKRGMGTLLMNVSKRLKVDLSQDGTLTTIMNALSRTGG